MGRGPQNRRKQQEPGPGIPASSTVVPWEDLRNRLGPLCDSFSPSVKWKKQIRSVRGILSFLQQQNIFFLIFNKMLNHHIHSRYKLGCSDKGRFGEGQRSQCPPFLMESKIQSDITRLTLAHNFCCMKNESKGLRLQAQRPFIEEVAVCGLRLKSGELWPRP